MNQLGQIPVSSPARKSQSVNPFARALAEAEREKQGSPVQAPDFTNPTNLFSDALARSGGTQTFDQQMGQVDWGSDHFRQEEVARKKEQLRRRLHDQVNPVDTIDVFNAREQQVKREIDQIRHDLTLLVKDVEDFNQEAQLTLMTEIAEPGQTGSYYLNFFHRLRSFIMLLRHKISSAKTWATQLNGKKAKKKQMNGMVVGGLTHEKTSTIQDMMHHERSSQYSGG